MCVSTMDKTSKCFYTIFSIEFIPISWTFGFRRTIFHSIHKEQLNKMNYKVNKYKKNENNIKKGRKERNKKKLKPNWHIVYSVLCWVYFRMLNMIHENEQYKKKWNKISVLSKLNQHRKHLSHEKYFICEWKLYNSNDFILLFSSYF